MESLSDEIRQFCSAHRLRLNTDMGQHFLIDAQTLESIVEAAKIRAGETIVEIGPGIGVLTRELLKQGAHVTAIELDERMIPLLQTFVADASKLKTQNSKLSIIHANALQIEMPPTPYKVVASIPYHITSPLLRHLFLESQKTPTSLTLLLQREVAEKICDAPVVRPSPAGVGTAGRGVGGEGGSAGILTILVALFGTPRLIAKVPPEAFLPPPKVDSAVLQIDCFASTLADPTTIEQVFTLVKAAFSQKRKMLRNTLGACPEHGRVAFHGAMERLSRLGIEPTRRPQTLSVQEWIDLAKAMGED